MNWLVISLEIWLKMNNDVELFLEDDYKRLL